MLKQESNIGPNSTHTPLLFPFFVYLSFRLAKSYSYNNNNNATEERLTFETISSFPSAMWVIMERRCANKTNTKPIENVSP